MDGSDLRCSLLKKMEVFLEPQLILAQMGYIFYTIILSAVAIALVNISAGLIPCSVHSG